MPRTALFSPKLNTCKPDKPEPDKPTIKMKQFQLETIGIVSNWNCFILIVYTWL